MDNSFHYDTVASKDGTRIACAHMGSGPSLVIVHGGFFDMEDWFEVGRKLAERFTVHLYDRRGRGRSGDRPDHYSFDRELDDLAAVMKAAGRDSTLLGHSFGGAIALAYALREEFKGHLLVYEAGLALRGPFGGSTDAMMRLEQLLAQGDMDEALSHVLLNIAQYPADIVAAFRPSPLWPKTAAMSPLFPREWHSVNGFVPTDEELASLPCRITLPLGTETQRHPYRAAVADLVERIPGISVIPLPGLNHAANLFMPEALAEHLAKIA